MNPAAPVSKTLINAPISELVPKKVDSPRFVRHFSFGDSVKYLVTGGAGFIGLHLVSTLLLGGHEVTVVDSGHTGRPELLPKVVKLVHSDIADVTVEHWEELLVDIDAVFHLAARKYNTPGVTSDQLISTNVTSTWNLAEASARVGVKRLVFTSSLYAYGSLGPNLMVETDVPAPFTLYGSSKLMGENILRSVDFEFGLSWAVARLLFVYGPGQFAEGGYKSVIVSNFDRIAAGEAPTIRGTGEQVLDYVYVQDVVDGLILMADPEAARAIVNFATGVGININTLTDEMLSVAKSNVVPVAVASDWTEGTWRVGSPTLASEIFGWRPTVALREGLQNTWNHLSPSS
jgi:UDP-glucose 4-epimerase